jgi:hypothetical protein
MRPRSAPIKTRDASRSHPVSRSKQKKYERKNVVKLVEHETEEANRTIPVPSERRKVVRSRPCAQ